MEGANVINRLSVHLSVTNSLVLTGKEAGEKQLIYSSVHSWEVAKGWLHLLAKGHSPYQMSLSSKLALCVLMTSPLPALRSKTANGLPLLMQSLCLSLLVSPKPVNNPFIEVVPNHPACGGHLILPWALTEPPQRCW